MWKERCMAQNRHPTRILLVDDNPHTGRVLARMLREDGFEVDLAEDHAAAIGRLSQAPAPDILLTDLRTPYADPMAVPRYGRERCPDLAVVVVTSYAEQEGAFQRALTPPPTVLPKPVSYDALSAELRGIVVRAPTP
jgi:CheY-like chemotaxis protein